MMLSLAIEVLLFVSTLPNLAVPRRLPSAAGQTGSGIKLEFYDGHAKRALPDIPDIDAEPELGEADFYALPVHSRSKRATTEYRPGSATDTHSCDYVRGVPSYLRYSSGILPDGLDYFYQKYTEAYGIPVISSSALPDEALKRACYVTRFLFADHSGIRNWYYKHSGRIAVMAVSENTTDIPEHSHLDSTWDWRARGLGATLSIPVSTGAEENVMCYEKDRYHKEDILLHEASHGLHLLGARYAIEGWHDRLKAAYNIAKESGLWNRTYAMSTFKEYFAEGAQSFFNCNNYADPPNGIHNAINTREKLKDYDPTLYNLIQEAFPCENIYLKRCETTRAEENAQKLKMNCNAQEEVGDDETEVIPCVDNRLACVWWARQGECTANPGYMLKNCMKSCGVC